MAYYPSQTDGPMGLPGREVRRAFFQRVRESGFDGIEARPAADEGEARELRSDLEAVGLPCVAVGSSGGFTNPSALTRNKRELEQTIRTAAWLGAPLVDFALITPAAYPHAPGGDVPGERISQGSSRAASQADFDLTAGILRGAAAMASDLGIEMTVEMHQRSITDNSWSLLYLLDLVDRPNVGANPDLANVYWAYEHPEETNDACIVALAPRTKYWHCKQLQRIHVPEQHRSYFRRVSLPDGDIDYRFAMAALLDVGYDGCVAIKGVPLGDQLHHDGRSAVYCRELLKELKAPAASVR